MKKFITILLNRNINIESIRKKFGVPDYIEPHVNLVYPFGIADGKELDLHIRRVTDNIRPFNLTLKGLEKSRTGHYLYLLVKNGKDEIGNLYSDLHRGILKGFENKDMPKYIPHLSLGHFDSEEEINAAISKIDGDDLFFEEVIKGITLATLGEDGKIKDKKFFEFGGKDED